MWWEGSRPVARRFSNIALEVEIYPKLG